MRTKVPSIIKNLRHIERQIEDARMIRTILKLSGKTRTDFVMIPALSQYTEEQQSYPNFDYLDIDTI